MFVLVVKVCVDLLSYSMFHVDVKIKFHDSMIRMF